MAGRRHVPSTVDKLGSKITAMIAELRIEHGWTIDEILAKLIELKKPVSRSALGRHVRSLSEAGAEMRKTREMALALAQQHGGDDESKVSDINLELSHALLMRLQLAQLMRDPDEVVASDGEKRLMFAGAAQNSLANAAKSHADRRRKDRQEMQAQAVAAVDAVAKELPGGLTRDTVAAIKAKILGIPL